MRWLKEHRGKSGSIGILNWRFFLSVFFCIRVSLEGFGRGRDERERMTGKLTRKLNTVGWSRPCFIAAFRRVCFRDLGGCGIGGS